MWHRWQHVLSPLSEAASGPKGRAIFCNNEMEVAFHKIKQIFSADTFLNYPDWKTPFTVYTDDYDKQLGAVVSQNDKPIAFFSRKLSNPHSD